jgi:two-component system, NarL family, nitrate/nitrite response regulator NarL
MKSIKIALVDDHQIVLDGLKLLLKDNSLFEIVIEENNPKIALEKILVTEIDVVITDIMMPQMDGLELSKRLKASKPALKIIALSMNSDGAGIFNMIQTIGVEGYLLKTIGKTELNKAISIIADGGEYYSQEIVTELRNFNKQLIQNKQIHLTHREIEIVKCISNDFTNKQIASELFISERTVETHRKNIFRKTNTHSVLSLITLVKENKII